MGKAILSFVTGAAVDPANNSLKRLKEDNAQTNAQKQNAEAGRWSAVANTKFRAPRQRHDLVPRETLLRRARNFALQRRVTLICAPAGFGKSTLLSQLATDLSTLSHTRCVWISLDEDDNDINRLFISLLSVLREEALEWEVDPQVLASQVQTVGPQSRAAVATLINALCSYQDEHLLIILDDLHRVGNADALTLLTELIDRLPPEVSVLLGSRTEPSLPLAKWRARGEMGELSAADLQFTKADALAMARIRNATGLSAALTDETIVHALRRTQGWPAGLQLMLGMATSNTATKGEPINSRIAERHLFDFFAEEVISELPDSLREFILLCSILPELSPTLCNAVTAREDSQFVLDTLYRRNLFLTAVDEQVPVLRFHDLFAEFLHTQLTRQHPGLEGMLHARAAAAENVPLRAVTHWLKAEQWEAAVGSMMRCAGPLLAEGGLVTLTRWLAQLPEVVVNTNADAIFLQALCALTRWEFADGIDYLERAAQGYHALGKQERALRCKAMLPRICSPAGQVEKAARILAELEAISLPLPLLMLRESGRVWHGAALAPETCAAALAVIATHAEQDPSLMMPAIEHLQLRHFFGMPGALPQLRRLRKVCQRQVAAGAVSWQIEMMAIMPFLAFWQGDRVQAEAAAAQVGKMRTRLSMVEQVVACETSLLPILAMMEGKFAEAIAQAKNFCDLFRKMNSGMNASWYRVNVYHLGHIYWMARDRAGLESIWPELSSPRTAVEWPVHDTFRAQIRGQRAIMDGQLDEAEAALNEAVRLQAHWRLPTYAGEARPSLAMVHLLKGDPERAWSIFCPVLEEVLKEDCLGLLLMEPFDQRDRLLALMPLSMRARTDVQTMLAKLATWTADNTIEATALISATSFEVLSEREREVLARIATGDSNKQIARVLNLSPHTAKRHVANILIKLNCSTRGQVAALWHAKR